MTAVRRADIGEEIEWLLRNAQRPAVADRAHSARVGEALDRVLSGLDYDL